ncbi:carbon storage regulator CsrA [Lacisediminihabitans sp.]|jgi:carbon storage regulator|uniref:carbon storage regulator CsrA n=1 Tax=Lacisediminihabitans sp. TaxID=2787631 RepID=UPI002F9452F9
MLVLTRKAGERILIGDDIVITILDSRGDGIRIGIDAPRGVKIQREEVLRAVTEANLAAAQADEADEDRIKAALGLLLTAPQSPAPQSPAQPSPAPEAPAEA